MNTDSFFIVDPSPGSPGTNVEQAGIVYWGSILPNANILMLPSGGLIIDSPLPNMGGYCGNGLLPMTSDVQLFPLTGDEMLVLEGARIRLLAPDGFSK